MAKKKQEVTKNKLWLVCTVRGGSEALFTVPLSTIAKKFKPKAYREIFEAMAGILFVSNPGGNPLGFDMFRYDPLSQRFAVGKKFLGVTTACFLKKRPWINFNEELPDLKKFLRYELGIPRRLLDSADIYKKACRVGSRELKIPAPR